MLATGHVEPTIRISDVTQPLNFAVFNRVDYNEFLEKKRKIVQFIRNEREP